jgi:hypothetical protein
MVGRLHLRSSRWLLCVRSESGVRAGRALVRWDGGAHTESRRSRRLCLDRRSGTGSRRSRRLCLDDRSGSDGSVTLVCAVRRELPNRSWRTSHCHGDHGARRNEGFGSRREGWLSGEVRLSMTENVSRCE